MNTGKTLLVTLVLLTHAALPASAEVAIAIAGSDEVQFDRNSFTVKTGERVTLTLTHVGSLPKQVMGHNLVILKAGVDLEAFAAAALAAPGTDYFPIDRAGDVIAHAQMIGSAEVDTIAFTAPAPGTYAFLCTFPGHTGMMRGTMHVE